MNTSKAAEDCDLFTLNKKFYDSIIYNDYPEVDAQLRRLAEEREKRIVETFNKANDILNNEGTNQDFLKYNMDKI